MELIKDFDQFQEQGQIFIANVKEAWNHATRLAVSAIAQYQNTKDSRFVDHLLNVFAEANGPFLSCFEKALYSTTNLKIRQDENDLDSLMFTKSKGNLPTDCFTILETIKSEGLRRYEGKAKTKQRATQWNNDGQRKQSTRKDTAADVTNLKTTDFGKELIGAAEQAKDMSPEQLKKAEKLAEQMQAGMAAILAGEEPEDLAPAAQSSGSASLAGMLRAMTADQSKALDETVQMLDDIARVKGTESVNATIKTFHNTVETMHKKIADALESLAGAKPDESEAA